jgi:hypothetical protein
MSGDFCFEALAERSGGGGLVDADLGWAVGVRAEDQLLTMFRSEYRGVMTRDAVAVSRLTGTGGGRSR